MANNGITDFLTSDIGMYGFGLPIAAVAISSMGPVATMGPVAKLVIGGLGGGVTIGALKGLFGRETPGMTEKELRSATMEALIASGIVWAGGSLLNIQQASAFMLGADQAAQQTAQAAGNQAGGAIGGVTSFLGLLFMAFLGSIAVAEATADFVREMAGGR